MIPFANSLHSGRRLFVVSVAALFFAMTFGRTEEPLLRPDDLVAICGDSITEQARYSVFIATYLAACQEAKNVEAINFGRGGNTAHGFLGYQLTTHVLPFHPTVATLC